MAKFVSKFESGSNGLHVAFVIPSCRHGMEPHANLEEFSESSYSFAGKSHIEVIFMQAIQVSARTLLSALGIGSRALLLSVLSLCSPMRIAAFVTRPQKLQVGS